MSHEEFKRSDRVSEQVRAELMDLVLRGRVRDPRVRDLVITDVKVTDDLQLARVYVRTLDGNSSRSEDVLDGLDHASGFLRREIGSRLKLRYTPVLEFRWDDVVERAVRMESIFDELRQERQLKDAKKEAEDALSAGRDALAAGRDEMFQIIEERDDFLVTCHRRPDADALGSALGMSALLRARGKKTTVFVPQELPTSLQFLATDEIKRTIPDGKKFSATFVTDTAARSLLPPGLPGVDVTGTLIIIDHHAAHDDVGEVVVRDVEACATAEVILDMLEPFGVALPDDAVTPLYAALVADTGGFRYPATQAKTLRHGADLVARGADPWRVAYELFEGWEPERLKLLGEVLKMLETFADGRIAMLRVSRDIMDGVGANDAMIEGMVNYARMLRGVEVAGLVWEFRAEESDRLDTKVSLRSRGKIDVAEIATTLGGGGHRNAAGAHVTTGLDETLAKIVAEAERALAQE